MDNIEGILSFEKVAHVAVNSGAAATALDGKCELGTPAVVNCEGGQLGNQASSISHLGLNGALINNFDIVPIDDIVTTVKKLSGMSVGP